MIKFIISVLLLFGKLYASDVPAPAENNKAEFKIVFQSIENPAHAEFLKIFKEEAKKASETFIFTVENEGYVCEANKFHIVFENKTKLFDRLFERNDESFLREVSSTFMNELMKALDETAMSHSLKGNEHEIDYKINRYFINLRRRFFSYIYRKDAILPSTKSIKPLNESEQGTEDNSDLSKVEAAQESDEEVINEPITKEMGIAILIKHLLLYVEGECNKEKPVNDEKSRVLFRSYVKLRDLSTKSKSVEKGYLRKSVSNSEYQYDQQSINNMMKFMQNLFGNLFNSDVAVNSLLKQLNNGVLPEMDLQDETSNSGILNSNNSDSENAAKESKTEDELPSSDENSSPKTSEDQN